MLQTLRDKSSGWLATVILGLLVVPFAFFGMEQYLFQRNDTYAAKIEAPPTWWPSAPATWPITMLWRRDEIGAQEFRSEFERQRAEQRQALGDKFDARGFEGEDNKRRILDDLVDRKVMQMAAAGGGVAVSDAQVRKAIEAIDAFRVDGKFDAQAYQMTLAAQNPPLTPLQFQDRIRQELREGLVPRALASSAFVTDSELDRLLKLMGEKRDVAYVPVPLKPDTAPVTPAEAKAWYDQHRSQYQAPETVAVEYVEIGGPGSALATAVPDEAALRARYEQDKARFQSPEQRLASHILVKVDAKASPAQQQAAQAKAAQLAQQAKAAGADFAALARADSDDSGSKANGGDLGWVEKGVMPKPFEDALFAMQPGEVRGPVRTDAGWHVIQLRELKAGVQVPFEQARAQLEKDVATADRERAYNELSGKVVDQVLKNPNSLAPVAQLAGAPLQRSGSLERGQGAGVLADPKVQRAMFSDSLIADRTASDPVELEPGHAVVLRVLDHRPAQPLALAQVGERVAGEVRGARARKAADAVADAILQDVRGGKPLQAAATSRGLLAPFIVGDLPRGVPQPDAAASQAFFALPAPAPGKVAAGKYLAPNGSAVVFQVIRVAPGELAAVPAEQRTQLRRQLSQMAGLGDADALVKALRKRMRIKLAPERL